MKILVIGSEGFIGKHCVEYFASQNNELSGCDLLDLKSSDYQYFKISRLSPGFDEIFSQNKFDVCINAAGSGSVPFSMTHPYADFEANTIDTYKLLDTIRQYNPNCKYINLSSAAVYGNPKQLPIRETDTVQPLSPYGWHKYYSELICKEYSSLYQMQTSSIRPFSVYGPGLKKQLFWDIYQKTVQSKNVVLYGTGLESRDFIYITDLVNCIALIIKNGTVNGEVYNAASGIETTIEAAATTFVNYIDADIAISFNGEYRIGDPRNWLADTTTLKNIGYTPQTSLSEGLEKYTQWIKEKE